MNADVDDLVIIRVRGATGGGLSYQADLGDNYTPGNVNASFTLRNRVTIEGGYVGASSPTERDPETWFSILSGNLGSSVYSRHVVQAASSITSAAILDGVIIRDGNANTSGGGMLIDQSDPIIRNCVIENNTSQGGGGGVSVLLDGNPEFRNCIIRNNFAYDVGGGILVDDNAKMINCQFIGNDAMIGGALGTTGGFTVNLINCRFVGNTAFGVAGQVHATGGAVHIDGSFLGSALVVNCEFTANSCDALPASGYGGGMWASLPLEVVNCTFANNDVTDFAGGLWYEGPSGATVKNSIFWDNVADIALPHVFDDGGDLTLTYCSVEGGWTGGTNVDEDPLFIDANGADNIFGSADDNYRLGCSSGCINAGNNGDVEADQFNVDEDNCGIDPNCTSEATPDLDLETRISATTVDLGAFEVQAVCPAGDATGDGVVTVSDLLAVINGWGACPSPPAACPGDLANPPCGNGAVDVSDLLMVINSWGSTCTEAGTEGVPESISDCYNDVCAGLEGTSWQRCMDACIEAVCTNNPEECD